MTNQTSWLDEVDSSFLDEVDASFASDGETAPPSEGSPADNYAEIVARRQSRRPAAQVEEPGAIDALIGGAKRTGRGLATMANVVTGDDAGVYEQTQAAEAIPNTPDQQAFMLDIKRRMETEGDESVWQAVKNVAGATWANPTGAYHEMLAQLPNSGVVIGGMYAGAKTGAVLGGAAGPGGAVIGGLVGGITGMFLGNTAIEGGFIAQDQARDGEYNREDVLEKAAIKGGFITGVDVATMGANRALFGAGFRTVEKALAGGAVKSEAGQAVADKIKDVMLRHGVNPADKAASIAAMSTNRQMMKEIREEGAAAFWKALPKKQKAAMAAAGITLESFGEGLGEYGGSALAGLDASLTEAVLEAAMSLPQSAAETAISAGLARFRTQPDTVAPKIPGVHPGTQEPPPEQQPPGATQPGATPPGAGAPPPAAPGAVPPSGQTTPPAPEPQQTLQTQLQAVIDGRKPAMLVTPGEQVPENLPTEFAVADLGRETGFLIYPRSQPELLDLAKSGKLGDVLGYGINEKPAGATDVVTARDKDGNLIQDVVTDGRPEVEQAAEQVAGPGGTVETRPATEAIDQRLQAAEAEAANVPAPKKLQAKALTERLRKGEISLADFSKGIAALYADAAPQPEGEAAGDADGLSAAPEVAQEETRVTQQFTPTHELSDGTQVMAAGEPGLWVDAAGNEIEDNYAEPVSAATPDPNDQRPPSTAVSPEEKAALTSDRRQQAVPVEEDRREGDRRQDAEQRKRVDEMSDEEKSTALLTNRKTGLPNDRAYEESTKKNFQGFIDVDGLKWINDNLNHQAGDALLKHVGQALQQEFGADAYHISGDEFVVQGAMKPQMEAKLRRVLDALAEVTIEADNDRGETYALKGLGFSYGIDKELDAADQASQRHKQERTEAGLRAGRGEQPPGISRKDPGQDRGDQGDSAEEETLTADEFDDILNEELAAAGIEDEAAEEQTEPEAAPADEDPDHGYPPIGTRVEMDVDGQQLPGTIIDFEQDIDDSWLAAVKIEYPDGSTEEIFAFTPKALTVIDDAQDIDAAAHEAATSPNNDLPEPTPSQKEAENYKVGSIRVHGLDISIENPRDSYRFKVDQERLRELHAYLDSQPRRPGYDAANVLAEYLKVALIHLEQNSTVPDAFRVLGEALAKAQHRLPAFHDLLLDVMEEAWHNKMPHHYGRILRTEGADGDHVDVFVGPDAENADLKVFVIDQNDPKTGKFDEHKVMLGFDGWPKARQGYLASYAKDWKGLGSYKAMSLDEFKEWLAGDTAKALSVSQNDEVDAQADSPAPDETQTTESVGDKTKPAKKSRPKKPSVIDRLENYFRPGRVVKSYFGQDRVIAFNRKGTDDWSVRVIAVNKNGEPMPGANERVHATMPATRDMDAWERENPIQADGPEESTITPDVKPDSQPVIYKIGDYVTSSDPTFKGKTYRVDLVKGSNDAQTLVLADPATKERVFGNLSFNASNFTKAEKPAKQEKPATAEAMKAFNPDFYREIQADSGLKALANDGVTTEAEFIEAFTKVYTQALDGDTVKGWVKAKKHPQSVVEAYREDLKDPERMTFFAKVILSNLRPTKQLEEAPLPTPAELEEWRTAMLDIAREYQKLGDTDNERMYFAYYEGRYKISGAMSVQDDIRFSRERLEERRQEIEAQAKALREQTVGANEKALLGLLKDHYKNHYLSKIITDQMVKLKLREGGLLGRLIAASYLLDAAGYPESASDGRRRFVMMNKADRKRFLSTKSVKALESKIKDDLKNGTFTSKHDPVIEPILIPSEKEIAAQRRITKRMLSAAVSALAGEHAVSEAARVAKNAKDFRQDGAEAVRAWVGAKGQQTLVSGDPVSAKVYAGMLVDEGAALNPVLFTDEFFADLYKKARAALKKKAPPKDKADAKGDDKIPLEEAAAEALAQKLAELNLPTDRAAEFTYGWNHVIGGGTQSNMADRAKEQVRKGYQAALDWMKAEKRTIKGEKQGSTGVVLKRVQDMRNRMDDLIGGQDNEVDEIFEATNRMNLLPADLVQEGATPGLMRYLDYVRNRVLPFKEWAGRKMGAGRRSWQASPEQAIRDRYETAPDKVIDFAKQYIEILQQVAEIINTSTSGAEAAAKLQERVFVPDEDGTIKWYGGLTKFGDKFEGILRRAAGNLSHVYLEGRGFFKAENDPYEPGEDRKKPLSRPRLDVVTRDGFEDHRKNGNITPQKLKETFGFADVTIGESVTSREEQDHLNYAYDALMDLATTLGIQPQDISFRGWLHFSIGALGHGRFAAHFQRAHPLQDGTGTVPVINLTKTRGDGTVAHEWFHALDFFLRTTKTPSGGRTVAGEQPSDLVAKAMDLLSYKVPTVEELLKDADRFLESGWRYPHIDKEYARKHGRGKRAPKIDHARYHLTYGGGRKRPATDFRKAADLMDKGSKDGYWAKPTELFARAAEAFVLDTMPGVDTYLVNDWVAEGEVSPPQYRGTPYPTGDERSAFNGMYGTLLESLEWTAEGPVIKPDFDLGGDSMKANLEKALGLLESRAAEIEARKDQDAQDKGDGWLGGTPLARAIFRGLVRGEAPKDNNALKRLVTEIDGEAPNALRMKEAQEDYEAALSQRARHIATLGRAMRQEHGERLGDEMTFKALLALYEQQPNLNLQTTSSSNNQAYSTPAPIAFLAGRMAGIVPNARVWEPTAGNAMLVMDAERLNTFVNEIEERRYNALRAMGFTYAYQTDATAGTPPLAANIDVVIMNPPFGPAKEPFEIDGYTLTKIDHVIAAKQLAAMRAGGRAVLILGANKKAGDIQQSDRIFFNWLYENYTVDEHFEVSGDLYSRQGAGWPIRIIVISGRAKSDRVSPVSGTIQRVESYDELFNRYLAYQYGVVVPGAAGRPGQAAGAGGAAGGRGDAADTDGIPGPAGDATPGSDRPGREEAGAGGNRGSAGERGERADDGRPGFVGGADRGDGSGAGTDRGRDGRADGAGGTAGSGDAGRTDAGRGPGEAAGDPGADLISADEFDAILEEELAAAGVTTPKKRDDRKAENIPGYGWMVPMTSASEQADAVLVDGFGWMVPVSALEKQAPPPPKTPPKTPKDHLKTAATETVAAFGDAFAGLDALFGGKGKLGSGLSFDEETYAKAKPLFKQAVEHALAAGKALKEAIREMIQMAIKQWGAAVKPYLQRFSQEIQAGKVKFERPKKDEAAATELQAPYQGKSQSPGVKILTPVNQSQAIKSALDHIEETYGDIDEFLMKELGYRTREALYEAFMGHQVDGVALAIHQVKTGGALIIGDQTGVGKGRQAAAVIRWAKRNGFTPIFITAKPTLYSDMWGDMVGIGSNDIEPFITNKDEAVIDVNGDRLFTNAGDAKKHAATLNKIAETGELPDGKGVLFTTYDQLQPMGESRTNPRQAVIQALAPRAVFILDEAHKGAGSSGVGQFIRAVLESSRRALYLSATYAKRPDNMPLYFLTDMSKAAETMDELISAVSAGGVPLMEIVSNQLAAAGQFIRRELSWEGISLPTWYEDRPEVNERNAKISDKVTEALRAIVDADRLFHEIALPGIIKDIQGAGGNAASAGNKADKSVTHVNFTAVTHNAISQLLLAIKAERTAEMAIEAHRANEKPVIALDSTLGSFLQEHTKFTQTNVGDELRGFDYRVVLSRLLRRTRRISIKDKKGKKGIPREIELHELPAIVRRAYEDAAELIEAMDADIPASPIDLIRHRVEQAGLTVKEVTGRDLRVEYGWKDAKGNEKPILRKVPLKERKGRVDTVAEFNNGKLDVIIMNVAGSTGISMHAAPKFDDTRPRRMIVAQAALDINVFMQMLGRINRNGQTELPLYRVFSTALPAEKRPNAVLSNKMKKLNANTSSNEKSSTSVDATDLMNKYGDEVIARYLDENPEVNRFLRVDYSLDPDNFNVDGVAKAATGRLALMPVAVQQEFYDRVEAEYVAYIEYLTSVGQNELIARDLPFDAELITSTVLHEGDPTSDSPFLADAHLGKYSVKKLGKPPTAHEVNRAIEESLEGKTHDEVVKGMLAPAEAKFDSLLKEQAAEIETKYAKLSSAEKNMVRKDPLTGRYEIIAGPQSKEAEAYNAAVVRFETMTDRKSQLDWMLTKKYKIGNSLRVKVGEDTYQGVITALKMRWKEGSPGNPFVPGGFNVTIMVNGGVRRITLPISRLQAGDTTAANSVDNPDIEFMFRRNEMEEHARETRYIVTGNLLAAYGEMTRKGEIIRFTMADGTVKEGMLMPKSFSPETGLKQEFRLRDAQAAYEFFQEWGYDSDVKKFGLSTRDQSLRVKSRSGGGLELTAAGSVAKGGKWWKNTKLTDLIGAEFAGPRGVKNVDVPPEKVLAVLEFIFDEAPLYALKSMQDKVKDYLKTNRPSPEGSPAAFFSRAKGDVAPPRKEAPATGTTKAEIQSAVSKLAANWSGGPKIEVVQSVADLPKNLRDFIEESDQAYMDMNDGERPAPPEALFDTKRTKVWLIADVLTDGGRAQRALLHESVAHYGLRQLLGRDLLPILRQVYFSQKAAVEEIARRYGLDLSVEENRLVAAEEVLAHLAEENRAPKILEKVYVALLNWLRKIGFDIQLTKADLYALLSESRKRLETGRASRGKVAGQIAMSRRRDTGPIAASIRRAAKDNAVWKILDQSVRSGPFDGGCLICAKAIRLAFGGELVRVVSDANGGQTEHYGTKIDGVIYDFAGPHASEGEWIDGFSRRERMPAARLHVERGHDSASDIPEDPRAEKDIAKILSREPAALFSRQKSPNDPELQSLLNKIGSGPEKPLVERIREGIDGDWRGRSADLRDRLAQASVDQFHGLKSAEQALGLTDHDRSAYIAARMSTSVDSQLMVALMKGPLRWLGNRATFVPGKKGLLDILQPVEDKMDLWEAYMVARRAERLMAEGRENWLTDTDIQRGLKLGDQYPVFKTVAADWAAFNRTMLDFAQDAGLIDAAARKLWENDDYIPFYRIMDDDKAKGPKGRRGLSHQNSGIRMLRGGKAQLNDILENMIMNTAHLIEASMKNHAVRMAVNNMMDTGLMTPAPFKFEKELIPMSQLKPMLVERGVPPDIIDSLPPDMLEGIQKLWALKAPTDKHVIKAMIDGKPKFYYVHDELLLRSLTSIDQQAWGAFMDIFRAPKRWLTTLVTADPAFQAANFVRDTLQAFVLSRENITPILSGLKGARKALKKSDEYWEMLAAGGGFHSGFVNAHDPGSSARIVKAEMRHKDFKTTVLDSPRKLWDRWMEFGSAVENANRLAVYEGTVKAGKSKLAAAYEAKDFMDFSLRGDHPIFNFLAQTVPFFNARLQGIYRLGRGMTENPASFAARGMLIALAGLALWAINKDDDRYKDLEEWDKDTYWHFWNGEKHYRFPKPFEVGFIFGTLPERLFEAMYRNEDDAGKRLMDRMLWNVWQVFNLGALPQTVAPIVEQVANRDFFRGAPIVGLRLERLAPEAQFTPWTHETSIQIGRALGVSPARVDHLLQGYFGTLGDYALTASDWLVRQVWDFPSVPAKGAEELPVVKRFYRGENERATRYSTEFYDLFRDLDKTYNTIREYAKTGDRARADALLAERRDELAPLKMLRKANEKLQKISAQARLIHLNRMMTPEEKRAKLLELQEARNRIYKEAVTRAQGAR